MTCPYCKKQALIQRMATHYFDCPDCGAGGISLSKVLQATTHVTVAAAASTGPLVTCQACNYPNPPGKYFCVGCSALMPGPNVYLPGATLGALIGAPTPSTQTSTAPIWNGATTSPTMDYEAMLASNRALADEAPRCRACDVEICDALDAYYGKDPSAGKRCSKCRPQYEKRMAELADRALDFPLFPFP